MSQPRIFISYARRSDGSRESIATLEAALESGGFKVLRDERMDGGQRWRDRLDRWMMTCHGAVLFLSPAALESDWVRSEVEHFARQRRARGTDWVVVPVRAEGVSWDDVERAFPVADLTEFQGLEARQTEDIVAALEPTRELVVLPRALSSGQAKRPARSPANLLRAAQEAVAFTGREDELSRLDAWLDHKSAVSAVLVHGAGGTGKTRLALQIIAQRRAAGWTAGFLRPEEADPAGLLEGRDADDDAPLLVAIDYAETRSAQVRSLLRAAAELPRPGTRSTVRVLLLARNDGEWWTSLADREPEVGDLLAGCPPPLKLHAQIPQDQRPSLLLDAIASFARAMKREAPAVDIEAEQLRSDVLDRPLYLQMAALHTAISGSVDGWRSEAELLEKILCHEQGFWEHWLQGGGQEVRSHTLVTARMGLAALTLLGGAEGFESLHTRLRLGTGSRPAPEDLPHLFADLYGDGESAGGLEPDLLGEHLVQWALERDSGLLDRVLNSDAISPEGIPSALTVLTRLADRTGDRRWLVAALSGRLVPRQADIDWLSVGSG